MLTVAHFFGILLFNVTFWNRSIPQQGRFLLLCESEETSVNQRLCSATERNTFLLWSDSSASLSLTPTQIISLKADISIVSYRKKNEKESSYSTQQFTVAVRAAITCFHFNFPSLFIAALRFCLPPGINSTYCFCLIVRFTPSIHICVRLHSALQREAYFYSCAVPVLPLTGQISDRPGLLSYKLLTNRVHAGERMCEQLNWVNCGIFLPTNDLRGKHDSAFTLSLRERGRGG